jgi:hypothetical protein
LTINNHFSKKIDVGYYILDDNNKTIFHSFKTYNLAILPTVLPVIESTVVVPNQTLMPSNYYFQFVIFDAETGKILDKPIQLLPIFIKLDYQITDSTSSEGIYIDSEWLIK